MNYNRINHTVLPKPRSKFARLRYRVSGGLMNSSCRLAFLGLVAGLLLILSAAAQAASSSPPSRMTIQSYLTDSSGNAVGSGTAVNKLMTFTLYTADRGGSAKWGETQVVTVNNGHFSAILGEGSSIPSVNHDLPAAFDSTVDSDVSDRFIEIKVADTDGSNESTLSPRLRMVPSAYSFLATLAKEAETVVDDSIDTSALAASAVTTAKIADGAVSNGKLANGSVGTTKIADNSVTSAKIAAGAVGNSDLALNAVQNNKILDGAVGTTKLADNAVNSAKIQNNTITADDIGTGAVGTNELQNNSVNANKIADDAVDTAELADGAVNAVRLADSIFQHRRYTKTASGRNDFVVATGYSMSSWFPVLMSIKTSDDEGVNVDGSASQGLKVIFVDNGSGVWRMNLGYPTHSGNHPEWTIDVLWIPRHLVNSDTFTSTNP